MRLWRRLYGIYTDLYFGIDRFHFFYTIVSLWKRRRKNEKRNDRFYNRNRLKKRSLLKTTVFIKFVVSLTIVNVIANKFFFQTWSFFKKQSYKKRSQIVFIKTIVIRWVVFKNNRFLWKRNNRFWKQLKNETKKIL